MTGSTTLKDHYPLVVIGAGPAGLAAASLAAEHGVDVALLDEQPAPGGQIYRAIESLSQARIDNLANDYQRGVALARRVRANEVNCFFNTRVWSINARREIGLVRHGAARIITAEHIILASGAMERPVPFPGWTLPGVMNAGAGQILFKAHQLVPASGVVLAGSGPLLLLLASQYLRAGVKIQALLDTTPKENLWRAIKHLPRALLAAHYLLKGLSYVRELKRAGVPTLKYVECLRAEGDNHLHAVRFTHRGQEQTLSTELLLIHFGVIPSTQLSQMAACEHFWDARQQCWRPQTDTWGQSKVPGILLAGDNASINGARSAEITGRIAALQAIHLLGKVERHTRDRLAATLKKHLRRDLNIRPFLEAHFGIPVEAYAPPEDNTIVCRCEEVTAGAIRAAAAEGHLDCNQVKFLTRCGMGLCQGRQCSLAVAHIIAQASGKDIKDVGDYRARSPGTVLSLEQLAQLYPEEIE